MFNGDYARKKNLVDFGFRLPSALDNRPLKFDEFVLKTDNVLYVSATPADYETERSFAVVEQIIRPTGLIDPEIIVKPTLNQVDDVVEQVNRIVERKERVLITTLTIKMAEQLADYLKKLDIKVQYIHSKIDTLERVKILHSLRKGEYDVLVGINLLREGLDLPEVSLVAILDADKEGFLRSKRSLIQISGRAARNVNGTVIMYADNITDSMRFAIDETNRRRTIQQKYNTDNNITPESVKRKISDDSKLLYQKNKETFAKYTEQEFSAEYITELYQQMIDASNNLEFEKAAELRDLIQELEK
jgi:excinuclease ABC subunit B